MTTKVIQAPGYNCIFNQETGTTFTWGETPDDDPIMCPIGPTLADIEISAGKCSGNCSHCSPAGTLVNIDIETFIPIEKIEVNDTVSSFKEGRIYNKKIEGKIEQNRVIATYQRRYVGKMIILVLEDGRLLKVTPEHKVMLSSGTWKAAAELKEDDYLVVIN